MEVMADLKEYTLEEYTDLLYSSRIHTDYKDEDGEVEYSTYKDTIFAIPDYRVPYLYHKLEPYFKKAKKLKVPYTFEEIGKVDLKDDENKTKHCIIIKLEFAIQIKGWKFIASIDHLPNGNVIRNISGADLPEKYRTASSYCDHCKTNRKRKSTYVVYSEKEGYKQVGKSCLFLYTGIDLNQIASAMDIWNYIHTYSSGGSDEYDDDFYCGYERPKKSCDAMDVLTLSWKLISIYGYAKKGSQYTTLSRYYDALDYLDGSMKRYRQRKYECLKKEYEEHNIKFFTKEDYEMAETVREWIMEQAVSSDYMNNLHVIFSNYEKYEKQDKDGNTYTVSYCYADKKYTNIIISAISVYMRAMQIQSERKIKHDKEVAESKYVGEIGKKVDFKIKDVSVITSWENTFGYRPITNYLYKIVSEDGNIFTWKTATYINIDKVKTNDSLLKGTVKEHNEYKGIKQTVLQRCKIEIGE